MSYQVALETFHGPMDLLLHLVKRNEVDILDIPIAHIAEQFYEYLLLLQAVDVELAGDFLVMAATLMEIKSRLLLPRADAQGTEEEEADPRRELIRQLVEYRKFKDAATALEGKAHEQTTRMAREAPEEPSPMGVVPVRKVELWDLVEPFSRILRETAALQPKHLIVDDTPQRVHEDRIRAQLAQRGPLPFRDLFTPPYTRVRLIGLFLALLELIKRRVVWLEQVEPFAEIILSLRPPEMEITESSESEE